VRTERHYIDEPIFTGDKAVETPLGETRVWEKVVDKPLIYASGENEWCFRRFEDDLGAPAKGMRWVDSHSRRFVLQIPVGWHLTKDGQFTENDSLWCDPSESIAVLVRTFFRPDEEESETPDPPFKPPTTIKYEFKPIAPEDDTNIHEWVVSFTEGDHHMMAQVCLLPRPKTGVDVNHFKRLFDETLPSSRMGRVFPD